MTHTRTKGVGIDMISITRLKKIKKSDFSHWRHVFSAGEWRSAFEYSKPIIRLAEMFAAKEAAMKAFGRVGIKNFRRFRVRYGASGMPRFISQSAALGVIHNKNMVIAVVLVL